MFYLTCHNVNDNSSITCTKASCCEDDNFLNIGSSCNAGTGCGIYTCSGNESNDEVECIREQEISSTENCDGIVLNGALEHLLEFSNNKYYL